MSGGADPHLRRLVDTAKSLDDAVDKLGRRTNVHPLGLGIIAKRAYSTERGKLLLPDRGEALESLKHAVSDSVLDLDEQHARACWQLLLGAPSAVISLPDPTSADLADQRLDVGAVDISTLRQVALVTVNRAGKEWDDSQVLTRERVAGVAVLTLSRERGPGSTMAWLQTQWTTSTREFVSFLEPHYTRARVPQKSNGARVAVVMDQDFGADDADELFGALKATALVSGLTVTGFFRDGPRHQSILNSLTEEAYGHLIMLGSGAGMDAVKARFRGTPAGQLTGRLTEVSDYTPLESLRERLVKIAGVSAALQPVLEARKGVYTMPITPADCLHDGVFVYVKDENSGLWWTRDIDGHGGSVFKTYEMVDNQLSFHADRDEKGDIIPGKWKGKTRRTVAVSSLAGCGRPTTPIHVQVPHPKAP